MSKQQPPALVAVYNAVTEGMWAYPYMARQDQLLHGEYPLTTVWDDRCQIIQMIVCVPARLDEAHKQLLVDEVMTMAQSESLEAQGATVSVDVVYWHHNEYYTEQTFSVAAVLAEAV